MNHDIRFRVNEEKLRFEADLGDAIAFVDYRWHKETLALMYIFVPPEHRGRGVSERLMKFVLDHADKENRKVLIYCSHIAKYIRLHPEYRHLLDAADMR